MALKADPTTLQIANKAAVIDEIKVKLEAAEAAVLTEYRGLSVTEIANLRAALRPADTEYKIYKNTLVLRAANEVGIGEELVGLLTGPVAIAFVNGDAAGAAKALRDFAKTNPNLVVKGGLLGARPLSTAEVAALADLPPRDVLLSQIAGLFEAPLSQTASVLAALLRDTVGLVQAYVDQRIAGGEVAPEPEPAAVAEVIAPTAEPEASEPEAAEGAASADAAPDDAAPEDAAPEAPAAD